MKKFINHVDDFLAESLAGFAAAHADLVVLNNEPVFVRRKVLKPGKVALVSGGGSGHSRSPKGLPEACSSRSVTSRSRSPHREAAEPCSQSV